MRFDIGDEGLLSLLGRSDSFRRLAFAAALVAVALLPASARTETCIRPAEVGSLKARLLQTELMVAALTCKRRDDYNRFIAKFGPELIAKGKALKAVFRRLYGATAEPSLNGYVTRLANEASLRSLRTQGYCDGVGAMFGKTLGMQPHMLAGYLADQPFSDSHGLSVCEGEERLSASR